MIDAARPPAHATLMLSVPPINNGSPWNSGHRRNLTIVQTGSHEIEDTFYLMFRSHSLPSNIRSHYGV
jgi:hypothetical protein